MADQPVPLEVSDSELFKGAMAEEPVREEPVAEPTPEPEGQLRDEKGRFAAKTEEPAAQQIAEAPATEVKPTEPQDDKEGQVPSWRLREYREERDAAAKRAEEAAREAYAVRQQMLAMQRQLEQLQKPKADPVDFFQDPNAAFDQRISPIQSDLEQFKNSIKLDLSREVCAARYGENVVAEAEAAVGKAMQQGHPDMHALSARMKASNNPVGEVIKWHKNQKLIEATGGDVDAYRAKLSDDLLNNPEFLAKAVEKARAQAGQSTTSPSVQIPPSLNKATGSGAPNAQQDAADMDDRSIFKYATASGRR